MINTTRVVQHTNRIRFDQISHDHTYAALDLKPKSNRMCSVYECTVKSIEGVFLHQFPNKSDMQKQWIHVLKFAGTPSKNNFVCNQHFHKSDYVFGKLYIYLKSNQKTNLKIYCRNETTKAQCCPIS